MRLLVCGGREYADREKVFQVLDAFHRQSGPVTLLIHGGAGRRRVLGGTAICGADLIAADWALQQLCVCSQSFPADWRKYGKKAGPVRNQAMIAFGHPEFVIAFPGGRGTADMVSRAEAAGIPRLVIA